MAVVFRITRELDFKYNAPEIVPGGIPVDLDAAARAQHEAAMGANHDAAPALVQIDGAPATPEPPPAEEAPAGRDSGNSQVTGNLASGA
jgi:uncharacterized protein